MTDKRESIRRIVLRHAVPSFFFGYILLGAAALYFEPIYRGGGSNTRIGIAMAVSLFCGSGTAAFSYVFHRFLRRAVAGSLLNQRAREERLRHSRISAATGFVCGGLTIFMLVSDIGLVVSTTLLVSLTSSHIRRFGRNMMEMLKPGRYSMWSEIMRLVEIYVNIIASFTLINVTLEMAHHTGLLAEQQFPFTYGKGIFIDAFYYTVVTMTTLGYGDMTPLTSVAKLLATFECVIGYIMFALTVGIITRGVATEDWKGQD